MIRVAIVEDDEEFRKSTFEYLRIFFDEIGESYEACMFKDGLDFLEDMNSGFNIVLFDIEMPFANGLEISKKFREFNDDAVIIFITHMAQYAIKGYEVSALGFMVKPVNYYAFSVLMKKAVRKVHERYHQEITIESNNKIMRINIDDIYYVEVSGYRVFYHMKNGIITVNTRMHRVMEQLRNFSFELCNQSYLVNLRHVNKIDKDYVVVGEETLKISRSRKKEFMDKLTNYLGGSRYNGST